MKLLAASAIALIAALALITAHWASNHYRDRPAGDVYDGDPRLRFRAGAYLASEAVERFRALPPHERDALRTALTGSFASLEAWAEATVAPARLVCLGERHHDDVRAFIAREILPRIDYRVLMLETGEDGLEALRRSLARAQPADLLEARIDEVVRAVGRSGIAPRLVAVDETRAERDARLSLNRPTPAPPSREETLIRKVRDGWSPGERHVVLIGALHCRDVAGWLFHQLASEADPVSAQSMHAMAVVARDQEAGARLLFYFLEEIGIDADVHAVPDVRRFPRQVLTWLPPLAGAMAGYQSVIFFDPARP